MHYSSTRLVNVFSTLAFLVLFGLFLNGCGVSSGGGKTTTTVSISTGALPNGQVGIAYSATLGATGGTAPYAWSLTSGVLPAGLSLSASTGAISGTPTAVATATPLTFMVKDSSTPASTNSTSLTLTIAAPPGVNITTTSPLPFGQVGVGYTAALAVTGGIPPYTWSLASGSTLPGGLSLNASTGAITGTPTVTGTFSPTFSVADSSTGKASANLTLNISPANITVSISPARGGLTITQGLSVTATSNDLAGVSWTTTGGSLSSATSMSGVALTYTAASSAGLYTVTATSVTSPTTSASATFAITDLAAVATYHNDLARDGANRKEYALTTSTVNTSTFGKLFSCTVDGAVYAQPLWLANVTMNGAKRNVIFVATQHDSLFAFDADNNTSPCTPLWNVSLIDSNHGGSSGETTVPAGVSGFLVGAGNGDITPEVGVTGTPVIDPSTGTLYVVSKSVNLSGPAFYQRLHAIDITTGNEKFGGPANLTPSNITYPGSGDGGSTVSFDAQSEGQRPGLALVNGVVYVAWASHEDNPPYYGWIVGFNASDLAVASIFNVTPNAQYGGIWMSGGAPAADANGNVYVITANGTFDADTGGPDYGDSFLQLSGNLIVSSYFTPSDQANDNAFDNDFGAGGSAVVLNLTSGSPRHLVIGGGKDGSLYLLDGDNMGGFGDFNALQFFNIGKAIFATGAFWNNNFYIAGVQGPLVAYSFNTTTNLFDTSVSTESATSFGYPGTTPSVSSNASNNGIIWALDNANYCTNQSPGCGPAVLHAYDATNLTNELWNSSMSAGDAAGHAVKFTVPTVANGKAYVGTRGTNVGGSTNSTSVPGELDVYGLKPN